MRNAYPSIGDVDDIVQESYLRIWKARAAQPIRSAKAFLFQVARRLAIDLVRRERASPIRRVSDLAALTVIDVGPGVVETVSRNEKIRMLADAIDTLPGRCREIFILRRLQCIPQREVAARFGLSERTVEVQVYRGLRRCEEFLRARGVRGLFNDEIR
ncbi:MAG: RNA polymerase sigma factor [Verrucomicrobia bacterium]|nr:RNA polymerase sigma factor [Verrucomicrobiota bacterium]